MVEGRFGEPAPRKLAAPEPPKAVGGSARVGRGVNRLEGPSSSSGLGVVSRVSRWAADHVPHTDSIN